MIHLHELAKDGEGAVVIVGEGPKRGPKRTGQTLCHKPAASLSAVDTMMQLEVERDKSKDDPCTECASAFRAAMPVNRAAF